MIKEIKHLHKLSKIYRYYKSGKTVCDYTPLRIWLEPTDKCNLACPVCINKDMPEKTKGIIQWQLFHKIIDQLAGEICDINLFHRGEPLLHPQITDMVTYCRGKGLNTRMHSNATMLTETLAESLIRNGLNYISFSFDGFDKETYEKNRVNGNFEITLRNITNFLKIKKSLNSDTFVVLQIIDHGIKKLHEEKTKFLSNFKDLPLNKVSIRTPHNWGGGISTKGQERPKNPIACTFPWYGLTIFHDGKVVPCSQDYIGVIDLGDAKKQTISEIWNGKAMQDLRANFTKRLYNQYSPCAKCDRVWRKNIFGVPVEYIGTFLKEAKIRK